MTTSTPITVDPFGPITFDPSVELIQGAVETERPDGAHEAVCFNVAQLLGRWRGDLEDRPVPTSDADVLAARKRLPGNRVPAGHLQAGVQEVWLGEPQQKRFHVYHGDAEPRTLEASAEVRSRALPGLQFNVNDLFRGV